MDNYLPLDDAAYYLKANGEIDKVRVIRSNGKARTAVIELSDGSYEDVPVDNLYRNSESAEKAKLDERPGVINMIINNKK